MQVNDLRIEFSNSRSYYFNTALSIAKRLPSFEEKNGIYSVYFTPVYFDDFVELMRAIYGWKTSRVLIGDRQLKKTDCFKLFTIYDCFRRRQEFENPKYYCFVPDGFYGGDQAFPCKQIRLTLREVVLKFGENLQDGVVHLNKERILFEIESRLRYSLAIYCPWLNRDIMQDNLIKLPNNLLPTELNSILGYSGNAIELSVDLNDFK